MYIELTNSIDLGEDGVLHVHFTAINKTILNIYMYI